MWRCRAPGSSGRALALVSHHEPEREQIDRCHRPALCCDHPLSGDLSDGQCSTQASLDEIEAETDRAARMRWEGSGLGPQDVHIFTPYDGYSTMTQFWLEAFQWHGVKLHATLAAGCSVRLQQKRGDGKYCHPLIFR